MGFAEDQQRLVRGFFDATHRGFLSFGGLSLWGFLEREFVVRVCVFRTQTESKKLLSRATASGFTCRVEASLRFL